MLMDTLIWHFRGRYKCFRERAVGMDHGSFHNLYHCPSSVGAAQLPQPPHQSLSCRFHSLIGCSTPRGEEAVVTPRNDAQVQKVWNTPPTFHIVYHSRYLSSGRSTAQQLGMRTRRSPWSTRSLLPLRLLDVPPKGNKLATSSISITLSLSREH